MKLQRIIFPEILLGKRGDPEIIKLLKDVTSSIHRTTKDNKKTLYIPSEFKALFGNPNDSRFMFLCKIFKDLNGKCYYVPKDFAQALSNVDKNIPIQFLPNKFVAHFQFAEGSISDDTGEVEGGFIAVGTAKELWIHEEHDDGKRYFMIAYYNKNSNPESVPAIISTCTAPLEELKIKDLLKQVEFKDYVDTALFNICPTERLPAMRAFLNAAVYLFSADPEIMKLRPMEELTHSQRIKHRQTIPAQNWCTVPITVLNFGYHEPREYSVDSTGVQTHMRWQRCGVGFSQVKLIWVKEHIRNYKKEVDEVLETH